MRGKGHIYGTLIGDYVCEFSFDAAEAVYYDKYSAVFERLVASATIARR